MIAAALAILFSWRPGAPPPPDHPEFRGRSVPGWLDSAFTGRTRRPWSGIVELELPEGRADTARVCGGPDGFRLDFRDGRAHWAAGDSMAFLDASRQVARISRRPPGFPPLPPGPDPVLLGADTCLGRRALVFSQRGPRGGARRMWIDTTLPLLLRGEGPGPGARRLLSFDPAHGCPSEAFSVPSGWKVVRHEPRRPNEEANVANLAAKMGFRIPSAGWLPRGFEPAGQSWIEGRRRRVAHVRWSDGARLVSMFVTAGPKGFRDCDDEAPCQGEGPDPALVRRFGDVSVLVAAPLPPEEIRRILDSLR